MKHPTHPMVIFFNKIKELFSSKESSNQFLPTYIKVMNKETYLQRIIRQGRLQEYTYKFPHDE